MMMMSFICSCSLYCWYTVGLPGRGGSCRDAADRADPRARRAPARRALPSGRFNDVEVDDEGYEKMSLRTCWRALRQRRRRGLDQRDDARLLPLAAAKGGGVRERDALAAGCGVGRVVAGRAGAGDDCG